MQNDTMEEIKLSVYKQNDQQIIEMLTSLAAKNELEQHDEIVKSYLRDALIERHGWSEVEHIEALIGKQIVA